MTEIRSITEKQKLVKSRLKFLKKVKQLNKKWTFIYFHP